MNVKAETYVEIDGERLRVVSRRDDADGIHLTLEQTAGCAAVLDWDAVKKHFDAVRLQYMNLQGVPGVNTSLALRLTFEPLAMRFNAGERTSELYDEMASVE